MYLSLIHRKARQIRLVILALGVELGKRSFLISMGKEGEEEFQCQCLPSGRMMGDETGQKDRQTL